MKCGVYSENGVQNHMVDSRCGNSTVCIRCEERPGVPQTRGGRAYTGSEDVRSVHWVWEMEPCEWAEESGMMLSGCGGWNLDHGIEKTEYNGEVCGERRLVYGE